MVANIRKYVIFKSNINFTVTYSAASYLFELPNIP